MRQEREFCRAFWQHWEPMKDEVCVLVPLNHPLAAKNYATVKLKPRIVISIDGIKSRASRNRGWLISPQWASRGGRSNCTLLRPSLAYVGRRETPPWSETRTAHSKRCITTHELCSTAYWLSF